MHYDWTETMNDIESFAISLGLEFHEVRNAWGRHVMERDAEFYEGHGVTSSDMNHMLFAAHKSQPEELDAFVERLAADKMKREELIAEIAATTGQHRDLVVQQLREFVASELVGRS